MVYRQNKIISKNRIIINTSRISNPAKWEDPFFMGLPPLAKLLMDYFHDRCDACGFIDVNMNLWSTHLKMGKQDIKDALMAVKPLLLRNNDGKKLWIKHFLYIQKQLPLNQSNPDHIQVIEKIKRNISSFENAPEMLLILNNTLAQKQLRKVKEQKILVADNPPTLQEWAVEYKKQYPEVTEGDIESSYGSYQGKNWTYMTNKGPQPLVDWKGAVRTCAGNLKKNDNKTQKTTRTQTSLSLAQKLKTNG